MLRFAGGLLALAVALAFAGRLTRRQCQAISVARVGGFRRGPTGGRTRGPSFAD